MARDKKAQRDVDQLGREKEFLTVSDINDLSTYLANLTDSEVQQLANIGSNTISASVWTLLANLSLRLSNLTDGEVQQLEGIGGASNSKLLGTATDGTVESKNASSFVTGTTNEITVADDGDGTITISGAGSDTNVTFVSAIQAGGIGGIGFQYKTIELTLNGGIITTVGVESDWTDV